MKRNHRALKEAMERFIPVFERMEQEYAVDFLGLANRTFKDTPWQYTKKNGRYYVTRRKD